MLASLRWLLDGRTWAKAAALLLLLTTSCESRLSNSLDGKACDSSGRCVAGYVCEAGSNLCVRPEQLTEQGTAGESGDGSSSCSSAQVACGSKCVNPTADAKN